MNPWIIVGVLLAVIGAASGGYYEGSKHKEDELMSKWATQQAEAVAAAVQASEDQAVLDRKAALEGAQKQADARVAEAKRNVKVTHEITNNVVYTNPDCAITDNGLRLIAEAANGGTDQKPADGVDGKVQPKTTGTGGKTPR